MTTRGEDYYADGSWNAVCYFCGFRYKATELRRHWQGFYVCPKCFEVRQPQDFVRAIPDVQTPPWVQPRPAAVYAAACYPNDTTAIPRRAIPGCVLPGYINPMYDPNEPDLD